MTVDEVSRRRPEEEKQKLAQAPSLFDLYKMG